MHHVSTIPCLAKTLGRMLSKHALRCAVAESCTGGALAAAITDIPGSSQWFDRGYVTYADEAKQQLLAVSTATLSTFGAVSEETAREMAEGVIALAHVNVSVAITGIAGPSGGSPSKPVGTVWIAWAVALQPTKVQHYVFSGDRVLVRQQSVHAALKGMIECVEDYY